MIFAISDYLKYRLKKGIYSNSSLSKEGTLITKEFLSNHQLDEGSIILFHRQNSCSSWAICYYTSSIWSHTATVTENNYVLDVTTSGIIEHSLLDYADGNVFMCCFKLINIPRNIIQNLLAEQRKKIGMPYGWYKAIRIFIYIIFAKKKNDFHLKFLVDFLILFLLLYIILKWDIIFYLGIIYLFIVLKNFVFIQKLKIKF